jgi:phosphonate transport system substrate-binding protein
MRRIAALATAFVALLFCALAVPGTGLRSVIVSALSDPPAAPAASPPAARQKTGEPLRVAIGAMIWPERTFRFYGDLFQALAARLHQPLELKQRRTYGEVNTLVMRGEVDLAWICTGAWPVLAREKAARLLAVPVVAGKTTYHALIVVGPSRPRARDFSGLSGAHFVFTDPMSLTGCLYPKRRIGEMGGDPERFFATTFFSYGHDRSIEAVRRGLAEAASVDSLVFDYLAKRFPEEVAGIRVLEKSEEFPIPPLVVPGGTSEARLVEIRTALFDLVRDEDGKKLLDALHVDGFALPDERAYAEFH